MVLYLLNRALFNVFFVYRTLNTKEVKYKNFLHGVGSSCISEVPNRNGPILMNFNCQRSKQHQGDLNRDCLALSPVISGYTNLKTMLAVGEGKRRYRARPCTACAARKKRSETRYICKFYVVPLHKYHSVTSY